MKNARILLALILCTTLFYSCTTDDLYEDENTQVNQEVLAKEGDDTTTTTDTEIDTGDDGLEEDDTKD